MQTVWEFQDRIATKLTSLSYVQLLLLGVLLYGVGHMFTHSIESRNIMLLLLMFWFIPREKIIMKSLHAGLASKDCSNIAVSLGTSALYIGSIIRRHIFSRTMFLCVLMITVIIDVARQGVISADSAGISIATLSLVIVSDQIFMVFTSLYEFPENLTGDSQ